MSFRKYNSHNFLYSPSGAGGGTIPSVVSTTSSLGYYKWGNQCEAWKFVDTNELSVKLESMPPKTEETLHYHCQAQQFFYILHGRAVFEIDSVILIVHRGEGLLIEAGSQHRIMNKDEETLQFLVCSQPTTTSDRHDLV